jgi:hypothetical protein
MSVCIVFLVLLRDSGFVSTFWEIYSFLIGILPFLSELLRTLQYCHTKHCSRSVKTFTTTTFYSDMNILEDFVELGRTAMALFRL